MLGGRAVVLGAQPARSAAGPARAVRRHRRAGHLRRWRRPRTARASSPSTSPDWWSATARPAPTTRSSPSSTPPPGSRRSRCSSCSACWPGRPPAADDPAGARGGRGADADRAAGGGVPLPRAVPLQPAREAVHLLGRPARRGRHFHRLDPAAGRVAECAPLLRRRLRRGAGVAAGAGLDHRAGGALSAAFRFRAAIRCRAGSSSTCPASSSRKSSAIRCAANSPYLRRGLTAVLGQADAGGARRAHPHAGRGRASARGRLCLSAGAAREGAGARPLLRRHAAAGGARSAPARRFLRGRRRHARRARRNLRPLHRAGGHRGLARRSYRRGGQAHGRGRATSFRSDRSRCWRTA